MQLSWLARGLRTGVLTTRYPERAESMPEGWRGVVALDPARCRMDSDGPPCVAACLPNALRLEPVPAGAPALRLDASACVACGRCIPACPAGALWMTSSFELAQLDHPVRRAAG